VADHPDIERAVRAFQADTDRHSAFRSIYEAYFQTLHRFFLRRGFSRPIAEELTQDTLFRVHEYLGAYEHRGTFATWLFTIAENVCRKEWQRRGAQKRKGIDVPYEESPPEDDDRPMAPPPPGAPAHQEDDVQHRERQRAVHAAIAQLAERQRQCLSIHLHGYTYSEIGALLQISPETVKRHLVTARKNLKGLLSDLDPAALEARESP